MSLQNDNYTFPGQPAQRAGGVYIALGSNKAFEDGDGARLEREDLFRSVLLALRQAGVATLAASGLWSSPAWPDPTLPEFANAVVEVDPQGRDAQALMLLLLQIEQRFGRDRSSRWGARTLDLDLIDFRGAVIVPDVEDSVICPHPRAHERSFVLAPLQQIAPDWRHPVLDAGIDELLIEANKAWPSKITGNLEIACG